jgi:hypothetical protein
MVFVEATMRRARLGVALWMVTSLPGCMVTGRSFSIAARIDPGAGAGGVCWGTIAATVISPITITLDVVSWPWQAWWGMRVAWALAHPP